MLALGLDARELQFFGEDVGQLIEREIDLHDVLSGIGPALALAGAGLALADDIAFLAVARADALRVIAIPEMRQLDSAHGNRDQMLSFLADELALGKEFAQILPDPALDDLPETLVIFFDLEDHASRTFTSSALLALVNLDADY